MSVDGHLRTANMSSAPAPAPPSPVGAMNADECICPICRDFIFDPVTAECGQHNFCKSCYQQLFKNGSPWKCPCCRERLTDPKQGTNLLLATLLQAHFPNEYAAARQRHLPPPVAEPSDPETDDDESDESEEEGYYAPPADPPLNELGMPLDHEAGEFVLGDANDPGVAAAAEELFQGAPGEEPPVPPAPLPLAGMVISLRTEQYRINGYNDESEARLREVRRFCEEHGATIRPMLSEEVTHCVVPSLDGLSGTYCALITDNGRRQLVSEDQIRQRVAQPFHPLQSGNHPQPLEPRAFHPNVILRNGLRRTREDSNSNGEQRNQRPRLDQQEQQLQNLIHDHPEYSPEAMAQLVSDIQRNQSQRLG